MPKQASRKRGGEENGEEVHKGPEQTALYCDSLSFVI